MEQIATRERMTNKTETATLVKNRDIVVIGIQPWYFEIGSNCKNIATQFAKHNRVLYVNQPINRLTYLSKEKSAGIAQHCDVIKGKGEDIRKIGNNMWEFYPSSIVESINWLPSTAIFKSIDYFNNRRFTKDLNKAIKALGFKDIILFNDNDIFNGFYLKELLKPSLYVYYCRDYLPGFDYWKKHCTSLEPQLLRKVDMAVANSLYLADYCGQYNPQSYYIGQGCNIELFDRNVQQPVPEDRKGIASPVIGYVGAVDSRRLDPSICEVIARANKDWNLVLVGPEDDVFKGSVLHQMPNVHFLGRKPLEQLPAYVQSFDVCINPQLHNKVTIGNYPLKIDEYLAMGKPVVATETKTMSLFQDYTYLAAEPSDYPALIQKALDENSVDKEEARAAFARTHTWENSMKELYKAINTMLQ